MVAVPIRATNPFWFGWRVLCVLSLSLVVRVQYRHVHVHPCGNESHFSLNRAAVFVPSQPIVSADFRQYRLASLRSFCVGPSVW